MSRDLSEIMNRLQERDYKLTPQRQTVVQAFLDNAAEHLSAEDVYRLVKERNPDIGLATVYRTLDILAEVGVLEKLDFGDGRSRYEFSEARHHHTHAICLSCGKILEFMEDLLDPLEEAVSERLNFHITDHQVKFYGYCDECYREKDKKGSRRGVTTR